MPCGCPACRDPKCEIGFGLCHCGCGEQAPIAPQTARMYGWVKGMPKKYVFPHKLQQTREQHPSWKGGRGLTKSGYVLVNVGHNHPMADKNGNVLEHRLVMAEKLGRWLAPEEVVHHENRVKSDNRPENLSLTDHARHLRGHNAKLDEDKVREIRRLLAAGERQIDVARRFGVSDGTISNVHTGRWWRHVT